MKKMMCMCLLMYICRHTKANTNIAILQVHIYTCAHTMWAIQALECECGRNIAWLLHKVDEILKIRVVMSKREKREVSQPLDRTGAKLRVFILFYVLSKSGRILVLGVEQSYIKGAHAFLLYILYARRLTI